MGSAVQYLPEQVIFADVSYEVVLAFGTVGALWSHEFLDKPYRDKLFLKVLWQKQENQIAAQPFQHIVLLSEGQ